MPIDPVIGVNSRPSNGVNQYDVDFFGSNGKTSALVSRFNLTIALPDAYKQPAPTPKVLPTPCPVQPQVGAPVNGGGGAVVSGTAVGSTGPAGAAPRVILPPSPRPPCGPTGIGERMPFDPVINGRGLNSNGLFALFIRGRVTVSQGNHELFAIFQDPSSKLTMDG